MQGLPKRPPRTADYPKERAERPRTIPRGSSNRLLPVPSERAIAGAPIPPACLQAAADQQRRRSRRRLPDSFPLNAGWGNKRDFYVRSCVNK